MGKPRPYKISCREEGRGKKTTKSFSTLDQASAYIQEYWQGVEYKDGPDGFHTDYSEYTLHGFTFKDIGHTVFEGTWPVDFKFNTPIPKETT
jgi:hypothetical protein